MVVGEDKRLIHTHSEKKSTHGAASAAFVPSAAAVAGSTVYVLRRSAKKYSWPTTRENKKV